MPLNGGDLPLPSVLCCLRHLGWAGLGWGSVGLAVGGCAPSCQGAGVEPEGGACGVGGGSQVGRLQGALCTDSQLSSFPLQPKPVEVQVITHHMQRYAVWFGGSMLASTVSALIVCGSKQPHI